MKAFHFIGESSTVFQWWCHLGNAFPLTPALSLGEREKRSQRCGKSTAVFCSTALEIYEFIQRLFPLRRGEGQGEGKARALLTV